MRQLISTAIAAVITLGLLGLSIQTVQANERQDFLDKLFNSFLDDDRHAYRDRNHRTRLRAWDDDNTYGSPRHYRNDRWGRFESDQFTRRAYETEIEKPRRIRKKDRKNRRIGKNKKRIKKIAKRTDRRKIAKKPGKRKIVKKVTPHRVPKIEKRKTGFVMPCSEGKYDCNGFRNER